MTKHKGVASITLLVTWEIWNERNARVFKNKHAPPTVVFDKIRNEARLWALAGAKHVKLFDVARVVVELCFGYLGFLVNSPLINGIGQGFYPLFKKKILM
jgi:hypothetical protein